MTPGWILICDGDDRSRRFFWEALTARGHRVEALDGEAALLQALEHRADGRVDLVLLDADEPGPDGLELLRRVRAGWPEVPVVMMSGFATVRGAVAAMKLGAKDFLVKPLGVDELVELVEPWVERGRLTDENRALKDEIRRRFHPDQVICASQPFARVVEMAKRVAASEASVLIQGESGTGKELIASTIHYASPRRDRRFLTVNCAALTETLLESQLFGHVKGAFTGATATRRGLLEEADGGTLFLDEIGDMSPGLQAKLLRVLQEKEFIPVGSTRVRTADVRFVAATNRDLEAEVSAGRFREDLFYRLNVVTLEVPPLRERPEDVAPLVAHFLARHGTRGQAVDAAAMELLRGYSWPGNVRELENVIQMAAVLSGGETITVEHLPPKLTRPSRPAPPPEPDGPLSLADVEARHIERVLRETGYHKLRTARILGISRTTLDRKIAQYGLRRPDG